MGKRVRLREGDIFSFDLGDGRLGIGQIIDPKPALYITVLRRPATAPVDLDEIATDDILLVGRTMDALFFHDRWHVIGNLPVPHAAIPRPGAKVNSGGRRWITDFSGRNFIRPATDSEWEALDFHSASAPIIFQDALQAHLGLAEKEPWHAKVSIDHMRAMASISR